jgi:hypothetical protein
MKNYKLIKKEMFKKYRWYHKISDYFVFWFVGNLHPKTVLSALNASHKDVIDCYGTLLSDDVEPAREIIKDFQEYVECESGNYVEVIVLKV